MSKLKMNCGYCGRKCSLDNDFCIPQDSIYVCKSCYDWQRKVVDLEAKLAEKEKEIEKLKKFDCLNKTFFDLFRTAFEEPDKVDDLFNTLKIMLEKQDQAKTDFAIEQLEKVKDYTVKVEGYWGEMDYVQDYIDNQIKELKEGK